MEIGDLVRVRSQRSRWNGALCIVVGSRPHRVIVNKLVPLLKNIATGEERWIYIENIEPAEEQSDGDR